MQIKFISFLDYQKKNTLKVKSQPKVYLTNKLPFNYIRAENLITNLHIESSLKQINFYFDLLHFRNMENRSPVSQARPHLDRFSLYLSIQLGFKSVTNFSATTVFQPREELNFFSYYNKPFSSKSTIVLIKSVTQKFSVTKYTRIDYQRKLQIIRRSTFLSQSQGYISFFSYIFSKNNFKKYTAISKKAKKRKLFGIRMLPSKLKLRSIKDETTKSPHVAILFAKILFRNKKINQFSAKKVNSLFPRKVQYRFTKRAQNKLKFQRKRKNKKVHRVKKRNYFVEKGKSYRKPRNFWGIQFKLFPSEYKEASLNANKFAQFKALVSITLTSQFSFYQVNALSLTRFAFDFQIKDVQKLIRKKTKFSQKFLESYERGLVSRFRGTGIFFKDLVRISFFSIYLKKADFLANFFAFTLSKLPRDRKELKFVRFLIKVLKTAASQNESILGVRIRFQGRVNRWRRTKHILGIKGNIGYFTYANRIEYGIAQAITRKGTLGVHIWICYTPGSSIKFATAILSYINLSRKELVVKLKILNYSMIQPVSRYFRKLNRHHLRNTYENKSCQLCFGSFGIQATEKGFLTVQQIETVRRTISSRIKRKGKIWIRAYPSSSCTAKPKEVRIGRGKGNVDYWYSIVKPGRILFEVKTAQRFIPLLLPVLRFALRKLPRHAKIVSRLYFK